MIKDRAHPDGMIYRWLFADQRLFLAARGLLSYLLSNRSYAVELKRRLVVRLGRAFVGSPGRPHTHGQGALPT